MRKVFNCYSIGLLRLKKVSPSSLIEIELEKVGKKNRFKRNFIALKPCCQTWLQSVPFTAGKKSRQTKGYQN